MNNTKFKKITALVFTIIVLAFLVICFFLNTKAFTVPFDKLKNGEINTTQFISEVKSSYLSNVKYKEEFININGFFARVTGRNHYNQVTRLKNGMLTYEKIIRHDMVSYGNSVGAMNKYLNEKGIGYLYVQAPIKVDMQNELVYTGSENFANEDVNELVTALEKNNVSYIDLRNYVAKSEEEIEKYFYKTDHHWNNDGAFLAFGIIMEQLNEQYPDANIDMSLTNKDKWNVTVYEDHFLGSHGKRVGTLFAGLDDYKLYTPKFDTDMSMYVPKHKTYYEGTFEEAVVVKKEYITNKNLFKETPYSAYVGGDYPLVQHRNGNASSNLKVLILKDSFAIPVQSFMSTAFKEIDVIDPRHFTECEIAEYIEATEPDVVLSLLNPSTFGYKEYYELGFDQANYHDAQTTENEIKKLEKLEITAAADKQHVHNVLVNNASFNTKYKLSFDDVEFLVGDAECITVALYNSTTKQFVSNYAFDIDYCRENGGFEWSFVSPEKGSDNLQILIYAGRHGQTGGNTVRFTNLKVVKYS